MSGQLVTLGALPAHLARSEDRLNLNAAARANLQPSFAVLKIRGKAWRVRYRGEETLVTGSAGTGHDGRPLPEAPVQHIDVIIVGVATAISKKFYLNGWSDGASQAPDCFSVNGISPDPASAHKQNPMCATCVQNIWGSATTDSGRKAKACRDGRRIAVVPAGDAYNETYGGPMLLDIPPTSLANLEQYAAHVQRQGADISEVVTRLSFNPDVTHQQLVFKAVGWVTASDWSGVVEQTRSDTVRRMIEEAVDEVTAEGLGARPTHLASVTPLRPSPAQQAQVPDEPDEPVEAPKPPPPPPAPPAARANRPSPFAAGRAAAPAAAPVPPMSAPPVLRTPAPPPTVVQGAPPELEAEIDNLLAGC